MRVLTWETQQTNRMFRLVVTKTEADKFRDIALAVLPEAQIGLLQAISLYFGPNEKGPGGQIAIQVEEEVEDAAVEV